MLGADMAAPRLAGMPLCPLHHLARLISETGEEEALSSAFLGSMCDEAFLNRLSADTHDLPDLGPRGTFISGMVDVVPDQLVGELIETPGEHHRLNEPLDRSGVWVFAIDDAYQFFEL
jgi:hypothetical protein